MIILIPNYVQIRTLLAYSDVLRDDAEEGELTELGEYNLKSDLYKAMKSSLEWDNVRYHVIPELVEMPAESSQSDTFNSSQPLNSTEPTLFLCYTCNYSITISKKRPALSVANGVDFGNADRIRLPELSTLEKAVISRFRPYNVEVVCQISKKKTYTKVVGHTISMAHDGPMVATKSLDDAIKSAQQSISFSIIGGAKYLKKAHRQHRFDKFVRINTLNLLLWLAVLTEPDIRTDYSNFVLPSLLPSILNARNYLLKCRHNGWDPTDALHSNEIIPSVNTAFDKYHATLSKLPSLIIEDSLTCADKTMEAKLVALADSTRDDVANVRPRCDPIADDFVNEEHMLDGDIPPTKAKPTPDKQIEPSTSTGDKIGTNMHHDGGLSGSKCNQSDSGKVNEEDDSADEYDEYDENDDDDDDVDEGATILEAISLSRPAVLTVESTNKEQDKLLNSVAELLDDKQITEPLSDDDETLRELPDGWDHVDFEDETTDAAANVPINTDMAAHQEPVPVQQLRSNPIRISSNVLPNEYTNNRDIVVGTHPNIFIFGTHSTFKKEGMQNAATIRHLFLQYTCAAAHSDQVLFAFANQIQRNATNIAANNQVTANIDKVTTFLNTLNEKEFRDQMKKAREGDEAAKQKVLSKLLKLIKLPGASIPWTEMKRSAALTYEYALVNKYGLPALFWTISPDDVRNLRTIRMSHKIKNASQQDFPNMTTHEFLEHFKNGTSHTISGYENAPPVEIDLSDNGLRGIATSNPIASTETFYNTVMNVFEKLIGLPEESASKKSTLPSERTGIYGTPYAFYGVVETQARGSLHIHLLMWGQYSPEVLQRAARSEQYRDIVRQGMTTMFQAEIDPNVQILHMINRAKNADRPNGANATKEPCAQREPIPLDFEIFDEHGKFTTTALSRINWAAVLTLLHFHSFTCKKPPLGFKQCRVSYPMSIINTLFGTEITRITPILESPRYKTESDFGIPPVNSGVHRDFNVCPVPERDRNILIWEHLRGIIDINDAKQTIDMNLFDALNEEGKAWIDRNLPYQNGLVTTFNPISMCLIPGNQCAYALFDVGSGKISAFYNVNYLAKEGNELKNAVPVILMAEEKMKTRESTAPDVDTNDKRTAMFHLSILLNTVHGIKEMSSTQAAAVVLGYQGELSSAKFTNVYTTDAINYIDDRNASYTSTTNKEDKEKKKKKQKKKKQQKVCANYESSTTSTENESENESDSDFPSPPPCPIGSRGDDDDDDEDDKDDDNNDDDTNVNNLIDDDLMDEMNHEMHDLGEGSNGGTVRFKLGDDGKVVALRQAYHYEHRGSELLNFSLYDYAEIVQVRQKPKQFDVDLNDEASAKQDETGPKVRDHNGMYLFDKRHVLFKTHVQQLRSKPYVPVAIRSPPTFNPSSTKKPTSSQKRSVAKYYLTLFRPWSIYDFPTDKGSQGLDMSFRSFIQMMKRYQLGSNMDANHPNPTVVELYRHAIITNMCHGLVVTKGETKALGAYRSRNATIWGKHREIPDGTEMPPGWRSAAALESDKKNEALQTEAHQFSREDAMNNALVASANALDELRAQGERARLVNSKREAEVNEKIDLLLKCQGDVVKSPWPADMSHDQPYKRFSFATYTQDELKSVTKALTTEETAVQTLDPDGNQNSLSSTAQISRDDCGSASTSSQNDVEIPDSIRSVMSTLSPGQVKLFNHFISYIQSCPKLAGSSQEQDSLTIPAPIFAFGGPGNGKTYATIELLKYCDSLGVKYICGAFAAAAASNLPRGTTLHHMCHLTYDDNNKLTRLNETNLMKLRRHYCDPNNKLRLLVIDELSMLSPEMLSDISSRLKEILDSNLEFGGLAVLMLGDMYQIPPVMACSLAKSVVRPDLRKKKSPDSSYVHGCNLFRETKVQNLDGQMRAKAGSEHAALVEAVRKEKRFTKDTIKKLKMLSASDYSDSAWEFATIATSTNLTVDNINYTQALRFAQKNHVPLLYWYTPLLTESFDPSLTSQQRRDLWETNICTRQYFVPGAKAVLTQNIDPEMTRKGICNGTSVILRNIQFADTVDPNILASMLNRIQSALPGTEVLLDCAPDKIIVELDIGTGSRPHHYSFSPEESLTDLTPNASDRETRKTIIPISVSARSERMPVHLSTSVRGHVSVKQFPIEMAYACTFHRLQGRTVDYLIIDYNGGGKGLTFECAYVAITRVRDGTRMRILPMIGEKSLFDVLSKLRLSEDTIFWEKSINQDGYFDSNLLCELKKAKSTQQTNATSKTTTPKKAKVSSSVAKAPRPNKQKQAPRPTPVTKSIPAAKRKLDPLPSQSVVHPTLPAIPATSTSPPMAYAISTTGREILRTWFNMTDQQIACVEENIPILRSIGITDDRIRNYYTNTPSFIAPIHQLTTLTLKSVLGYAEDYLINRFMDILTETYLDRTISFSCQFVESLPGGLYHHSSSANRQAVEDRHRQRIFQTRHIFMPYNINNNHWVMLWVDNTTNTAIVLDSINNDDRSRQRKLKRTRLLAWLTEQRLAYQNTTDIIISYQPANIAPQRAGDACGSFICTYAYFILRHDRLPTDAEFTSANSDAIRAFVLYTTMTGSLPR